jgi:hypothetical protein
MAREGVRDSIVEEMLSTACTVVYLIEVVTYLLSLNTGLMNREFYMTVSWGASSAWWPWKLDRKLDRHIGGRFKSLPP